MLLQDNIFLVEQDSVSIIVIDYNNKKAFVIISNDKRRSLIWEIEPNVLHAQAVDNTVYNFIDSMIESDFEESEIDILIPFIKRNISKFFLFLRQEAMDLRNL